MKRFVDFLKNFFRDFEEDGKEIERMLQYSGLPSPIPPPISIEKGKEREIKRSEYFAPDSSNLLLANSYHWDD